jgi:hypothetical protein
MKSIAVLLALLSGIVACGGGNGGDRAGGADGGSSWQDQCTSYSIDTKYADTVSGPLGVPYSEYACKSEKYGNTTIMVFQSKRDKDAARPIMRIWVRTKLDPNMDIVSDGETWVQLGQVK